MFHNSNVGRLYRLKHRHLRKIFNPGHPEATPILPTRKSFKTDFGNIEYTRQNFALSVAYAVTAHKSQGETLEYVIVDFGPDKENNIKNFICAGSFYVAISRVRESRCLFLKSFDPSYIQVNQSIQEKMDAMLKFRRYEFKKIYIEDKIFCKDNQELKVGYLNINGLLDAEHINYFNSDKNLTALDMIVLAETKLQEKNSRNTSTNPEKRG